MIDRSNALMTIESTDPELPWIADSSNPCCSRSGIRRRSRHAPGMPGSCSSAVLDTSDGDARFMLHDFGYRGATSEEAPRSAGPAISSIFQGRTRFRRCACCQDDYGATTGMAYSVAASQHSVMTSGGEQAEHEIARDIIRTHPNQTVSLVADSYDYYAFVDAMIAAHDLVARATASGSSSARTPSRRSIAIPSQSSYGP